MRNRLTIKSPIKGFVRNQSSMSRRGAPRTNSRMKENRLNSQASRIEERISRLNGPAKQQKQQKGPEMFFFEAQNENKIIDVKIKTGDNNVSKIEHTIKSDPKKLDSYLKRKNYGNKWYITPKKWEKVMKKDNHKKMCRYLYSSTHSKSFI